MRLLDGVGLELFADGWTAAFDRPLPAATRWLLQNCELFGLTTTTGRPVAGFAARPATVVASGGARRAVFISDLWVRPESVGNGLMARALRSFLDGSGAGLVAGVFVNRKRRAGKVLSSLGFVAQRRLTCVSAPVTVAASPAVPPAGTVVHADSIASFGLAEVAALCRPAPAGELSLLRSPEYLDWRFDRMPREYWCVGSFDPTGVLQGFALAKLHPPKGRLHVLFAGGPPAVVGPLVRALAERAANRDDSLLIDLKPPVAARAGVTPGSAGFREEETIWTPYLWDRLGQGLAVEGDEISTV